MKLVAAVSFETSVSVLLRRVASQPADLRPLKSEVLPPTGGSAAVSGMCLFQMSVGRLGPCYGSVQNVADCFVLQNMYNVMEQTARAFLPPRVPVLASRSAFLTQHEAL
jgi:hypothetical protein